MTVEAMPLLSCLLIPADALGRGATYDSGDVADEDVAGHCGLGFLRRTMSFALLAFSLDQPPPPQHRN